MTADLCCATVPSSDRRCQRYPTYGRWLCWQHELLNAGQDDATLGIHWQRDRAQQWEQLKTKRDAAWTEYQNAQALVEQWTCRHGPHWALQDQECQFHLLLRWTPLIPQVAEIVGQYMEPWRPSNPPPRLTYGLH